MPAIWTDELTDEEKRALEPGVPPDFDRTPDVLVVGGGVMGLATAQACRSAGLGSVVVIERADGLASGSSGSAAGGLNLYGARMGAYPTDPTLFVEIS